MSRTISVVVPCYNEEEVITETHKRLFATCEKLSAERVSGAEIIYVNDGSRDATLSKLQQLAQETSALVSIRVICLARNFGHQIALSAGLANAHGDAVIAIDADLQDPPEVMELMVEKWLQGADVVYGQRLSRAGENLFKLVTARLFYIVVKRITRIDIPLDTGDFRLMSRRVLDVFNGMPERHRFVRGMVPWIGFRQEAVTYHRAPRFAGETKYPLTKMLKLALDGITSFSNAPLRTAYLMGVSVAGLSILYAISIVWHSIRHGYPVVGWASLMVAILFMGSVQLITIGILGEYIGRIYDQVKARPLFTIDRRASVGVDEAGKRELS